MRCVVRFCSIVEVLVCGQRQILKVFGFCLGEVDDIDEYDEDFCFDVEDSKGWCLKRVEEEIRNDRLIKGNGQNVEFCLVIKYLIDNDVVGSNLDWEYEELQEDGKDLRDLFLYKGSYGCNQEEFVVINVLVIGYGWV